MKSYSQWAIANVLVHRAGGKVTYIQLTAFGSSWVNVPKWKVIVCFTHKES